jgi:hypothetical protein
MSSLSDNNVTLTQHGATIQNPILDGCVASLKALLQPVGNDITGNPLIPFARLPSVHFMSWFVVESSGTSWLFLEINVDSPIESFLKVLVTAARAGLDQIYSHCVRYPGKGTTADIVVQYLLGANIGYDCYYIAWRGIDVQRILRERDLRARLERHLDQTGDSTLAAMQPAAIRSMLQQLVNAEPALCWTRPVPVRPFLVRCRSAVLLILGVLGVLAVLGLTVAAIEVWRQEGPWPVIAALAVVAGLAGGLLGYLRWREMTDFVADAQPSQTQVASVVNQENRVVQNHFASVVDVKPGRFRWALLKLVLKLIHLLAALSFNQGNLSGITSIHFARWVVINGGKQLLFLSNYDGSWEKYLDDFIDQASNGLTAIWSNTVGFPRSYYLVGGGARDELLFKTLVRQSQHPSLVWYSAYPDLTTQNIKTNAVIREGLFAPMCDDEVKAWLGNF